MKFSFGCLNAVLVSTVAMANENEQQQPVVTSTRTIISINDLIGPKKNLHLPSSFDKVMETPSYKRLSYRTEVRDEPTRIKNIDPVDGADTDVDMKANVNVNVNQKEAVDITTMAVSAAASTTAGSSGEEKCVPPVTFTKTDKLDAGNLPLSSCSSTKHICVNDNNKERIVILVIIHYEEDWCVS